MCIFAPLKHDFIWICLFFVGILIYMPNGTFTEFPTYVWWSIGVKCSIMECNDISLCETWFLWLLWWVLVSGMGMPSMLWGCSNDAIIYLLVWFSFPNLSSPHSKGKGISSAQISLDNLILSSLQLKGGTTTKGIGSKDNDQFSFLELGIQPNSILGSET